MDLDVLGRADLLKYLQEETEERKATIIHVSEVEMGSSEHPKHYLDSR